MPKYIDLNRKLLGPDDDESEVGTPLCDLRNVPESSSDGPNDAGPKHQTLRPGIAQRSGPNFPPREFDELLSLWRAKCRKLRDSHYQAASRLNQLHYLVGVPATVLSTIVGTAVFASLGESVNTGIRVIVGVTSVFAAVLSGLVTFMRFGERAEEHKKCAAGFESIVREIDSAVVEFGGSNRDDDPARSAAIAQIGRRLDELGFGLMLPR